MPILPGVFVWLASVLHVWSISAKYKWILYWFWCLICFNIWCLWGALILPNYTSQHPDRRPQATSIVDWNMRTAVSYKSVHTDVPTSWHCQTLHVHILRQFRSKNNIYIYINYMYVDMYIHIHDHTCMFIWYHIHIHTQLQVFCQPT